MNASNRWLILVLVLGVLIVIALIPIAFLFGRALGQPQPTPVVFFPTATFQVVLSPTAISLTPTEIGPLPTVQFPTSTPLPTLTPLPSNTPLPTATPLPTNTPPPTSTFTPVPPTLTPTPSIPCNAAQFVANVTVPDGTYFAPDVIFFKIWRIKNIGSCTWTTNYNIHFVSGEDMANNKNELVAFPQTVKPGETVDLEVKLTSPGAPGVYVSNWMLESNTGADFGFGSNGNIPLDVTLQVLNVDPSVAFDFALKVCEAEWENGDGKDLACPGAATGADGFVVVLANPSMEHRKDNEPALWINPDNETDGSVTGIYPLYKVKNHDHFRATIGCLADNPGCNVTFELSVMKKNGNVVLIDKWTETFDGSATEIDIELTDFVGQNVHFVLTVTVNNQKFDKADAFWFVPRIVNEP